jgi:glycosyltransferase involved in cell wall biosynthesis
MRILGVVPTSETSGAERVLLRYLVYAREHGWDVCCLVPDGWFAAELAAAGVPTAPLPALTMPTGVRAAAMARLMSRWLPAARRVRAAAEEADVVLVNGFLALPAVRLAGVSASVGWLVHDVIHKREWRGLLHLCAGAVDTAFPVSTAAAGPILAAGIHARIVRNGTVWPVAPAEPAAGLPVVGINAMLTSWKGQDVLLDAVGGLDVPVRVELMGGRFARDGDFVDALTRRAAAPDLAGRVEILGHVDDPLARMRTWTVAVSASVGMEAAPLNVLEAMSIGLPMVATGHGGTPEVLGDAGLLVPPHDPGAMATALRRLLTDPGLYRRCAAAGPLRIETTGLRLEDAAADFLGALSELARSGGRTRTEEPLP